MKNDEINYWPVKSSPFRSRTYEDAKKQVADLMAEIKGNSKRKIHVRSKYFKKKKVFFTNFWDHLFQKPIAQRKHRLRFFPCAVELIKSSQYSPTQRINSSKSSETLYRFHGITHSGQRFVLQIKKGSNGNFQLMSVFPKDQ